MSTGSHGKQDEIVRRLARVRSALHEFAMATQHTMAQHERMAGWYAEQGDQAAALMEGRAAAVQRQRLADIACGCQKFGRRR